ncbi:hypothetical protein GCG21_09875 [Pseudactinotalea sp. HY160]|uniref:hypothetical protein n=1 Tax=Pseudactinotalea sp. HY160 TaxID=2654490 RepID=UPI00128D1471|nr:hypothetical protein [Pseudactinotalea sp. HY160]MPV50305.1 hypothetical protein [Pseudactinotalea sp. HY160]
MTRAEDWRAERTRAAAEHAARLEARQAAEHAEAAEFIERFVERARAARLPAEPLRVQGYGGRGSARTPFTGWYLRRDRRAALGEEGDFYVLTAPLSVLDRIRGVRPEPVPAPLVLGQGGKDGESIDLVDALERLLPGWRG